MGVASASSVLPVSPCVVQRDCPALCPPSALLFSENPKLQLSCPQGWQQVCVLRSRNKVQIQSAWAGFCYLTWQVAWECGGPAREET